MAIETKHNLNEKTIDKLQDLIQLNIDSETGFSEAAKQIDDSNLSALFIELGSQRAQNAAELQEYVQWNGERPRDEGTYLASLHRTWIDIRSSIAGNDAHSILAEAERGEDYIKEAYEDVIKDCVGCAVSDVLHQQYANVKAGHDRVRDLRDQYND